MFGFDTFLAVVTNQSMFRKERFTLVQHLWDPSFVAGKTSGRTQGN